MSERFTYDVFLSHSSHDKEVVRELAQRLRGDGVKVWFDEWEIQIGDLVFAKVQEGLQQSRVLVLCMSRPAYESEWSELERHTFLFRDPLNKQRRFIPLRLDDAQPPEMLRQYLYADWHGDRREAAYSQLLAACRGTETPRVPDSALGGQGSPIDTKVLSLGHTNTVSSVTFSPDWKLALSGSWDKTVRVWDLASSRCLCVFEGHTDSVRDVAWSTDGRRVLSGASDQTVRLWDVESSRCVHVLEGHMARVLSVSWSTDGRQALSGSMDQTVRLWDVESGRCMRVLEGHMASVMSVSWSTDGQRAVSGSVDEMVRLWDVESGRCLRVLEGHTAGVMSVSWCADGARVISGSSDQTIRVWDVESGRCLSVLNGHKATVASVFWCPDGARAISGSSDQTVRIWDVVKGRCKRVLKGHTAPVRSVSLSRDGQWALSGSEDQTVRLWDVESGRCLRVLEGHKASVWSASWNANSRRVLSASSDHTVRLWELESGRCLSVLAGHTGGVNGVCWSADGRRVLSASSDHSVRLWEAEGGRCLRVLDGHVAPVLRVTCTADGGRALSGSDDRTVRLWETESGRCLRVFQGHTGSVWGVSWCPDGRRAMSASEDRTIRLWDLESGSCLRIFEGHTGSVRSVSWSADGGWVLSGSEDRLVRLWEVESGRCLRVLQGHTDSVNSVSWSADGRQALSASSDHSVRLWDLESGCCLRVLEAHTAPVRSVSWSIDGRHAFSQASNGVIRVWHVSDMAQAATAPTAPPAAEPGQFDEDCRSPTIATPLIEDDVQYTNAKVLLVGESAAGKTGLAMRLAENRWEESDSTVGAWATQWPLPVASDDGVKREIWLWDFGGQADQRLIHQLYMHETELAVLVFDGDKPRLFETLGEWDRDLTKASSRSFQKLLVAGRVDVSRVRVDREQLKLFAQSRGFRGELIETSAKENRGCDELRQAIEAAIPWDELPCRSTLGIFKRLKDEIVKLRDEGRVLMRFNELRDALTLRLSLAVGRIARPVQGGDGTGDPSYFTDEQLETVLTLLMGPGVVWELGFGRWVLLQPERINACAQAVIQTMSDDAHGLGCIAEEDVLRGELRYSRDVPPLPADDERIVRMAMHAALIDHHLCWRETDATHKTLLVFPSYYRRERPEPVGHPAVFISYQFSGFLDDIYATLVVRLHHTAAFVRDQLWNYAADFTTQTGQSLGVKLTRRAEGAGELAVYFDPTIPLDTKLLFAKFVHEHLKSKVRDAGEVLRLRHYVCPHCHTPVQNREIAMKKLAEGKKSIVCVNCEKRVPLWDELEDRFASDDLREAVRRAAEQGERVKLHVNQERALVGDVISTVLLAGQIAREFSIRDHGMDMEIEFRDDAGTATGRKLFLLLRSDESSLTVRDRDESASFRIEDWREATYWMQREFPVLLVVRNSAGEVRWMEIVDVLRKASQNGQQPVKEIEFDGERLDVMSVRRWRERVLGRPDGQRNF